MNALKYISATEDAQNFISSRHLESMNSPKVYKMHQSDRNQTCILSVDRYAAEAYQKKV